MPEADGDAWIKEMLAEAMLNEADSSTVSRPATVAPSFGEPIVEPEITPDPVIEPPVVDFTPEPVAEPEITPDPVIETPVVDFTPDPVAEPEITPDPAHRPALQWPSSPALDASDPTVPNRTASTAAVPSLVARQPTAIADDVLVDEATQFDQDVHASADKDDSEEEPGFVRGLVEWVVVLVGAVIVALLLRAFLFQAFWIPSQSMEMTLLEQDRVLVNKLSYRLHDVNRGDVIVFRRPDEEQAEIRDLIKRVIGLPGEEVEARNNNIYIDGSLLIEPYLAPGESIPDFGPTLVPANEVFVMGDNRDESYDSRFFGTVDEDRIVGRAFVLFWPLDRVGTL